jgi:hypothetical protein
MNDLLVLMRGVLPGRCRREDSSTAEGQMLTQQRKTGQRTNRHENKQTVIAYLTHNTPLNVVPVLSTLGTVTPPG